jgi:hypothetical protein
MFDAITVLVNVKLFLALESATVLIAVVVLRILEVVRVVMAVGRANPSV